MNLEGTKTQANLMAAFAGECQARTKYTYFASKAKRMALFEIANLLWKLLKMKRSMQKSGLSLRMMVLRILQPILRRLQQEKNYEWTDMYAEFAKDAREKRDLLI